jgi:hypothetical protein
VGIQAVYKVGNTVCESAFTDKEGRFRLQVAPAKGAIRIVPPPGFMTKNMGDISVDMGDAHEAKLSAIALVALPTISGTVLGDDGKPAGKVLLSSLGLDPPVWAISDDKGQFTIRLNYFPDGGRAAFRAEHPLRFLRKDFACNFTESAPIEVRLEPFEPDLAKRGQVPGHNNLQGLIDKPAPEIKCSEWINSPQPVTIEELRGKVAVLTMWGGFDNSPQAVNRIDELRALHDLLADVDDVAIISVHDGGTDMDEIEKYVHRLGITFPVGRDAEPLVTFTNYCIGTIPQTVLIDKRGVLRYQGVDGRLLELIKGLRRE